MKRLASIAYGMAVILIFGTALCADSIMDTYGPVGFLLRAGACIGIAGAFVLAGNYIENREKENRPRYRNYRGRRGKRKR